jgi:asparaginyl-tRNA synthetase
MKRIKIQKLSHSFVGQTVTVAGWVRTIRAQKNFSFIELYDGSCFRTLQIIADEKLNDYESIIANLSTGASVKVTGLVVKSPKSEQAIELQASQIEVMGLCPAETYPLQKKRHSFEFLRTIAQYACLCDP